MTLGYHKNGARVHSHNPPFTHTHTQHTMHTHILTHTYTHTHIHSLTHTYTGASVVVILVHAILMGIPDQTTDEELGIVMEDVTIS